MFEPDIDGDGRLDYCVISDAGELTCWRSGGIASDHPDDWQELGVIWKASDWGMGGRDIAEMRLGKQALTDILGLVSG